MKNRILISLFCCPIFLFAQFPGGVGTPGTTAMYKDTSAFVAWAKMSHVTRGLQDISTPSLGLTTVGDSSMVSGKADGGVVSLGDAGEAIVTFSAPVINGTGYDFAVFENSFNDTFLELAFVEVSSDGVNYFRFPATSNSPVSPQYTNSAVMDPTKIDNLAGKYRGQYGTPFDLQQLTGNAQLNLNAITHIKIIDVVGSINPTYARYDKNNNIINDPWPTAFASGGFDLDAIAVINQSQVGIKETAKNNYFRIYPNPFTSELRILTENESETIISLKNMFGQELRSIKFSSKEAFIETADLESGIYFVEVTDRNSTNVIKLIRN